MSQEKPVITADMLISEILQYDDKNRGLFMIILGRGLHCVGCFASQMETLAQGCMAHGMTDEEINALVDELNEYIGSK